MTCEMLELGVLGAQLPSYFEKWNELAKSLPSLLREKKVREAVHQLPLLDHSLLQGHQQLRLAHLQLIMITAYYIWQDGDSGVPKVLPKNVAIPLYKISEELGIKPILGHVDLALANWALIDESRPIDFGNLKCLYEIPGGFGGQWFFIVTFMVEFTFAGCLKPIVRVADMLHSVKDKGSGDQAEISDISRKITACLEDICETTCSLKKVLTRMHDHLSAKTFFNSLRPFLAGWGGEGNALPEGLIYEGISDTPIQLPGGSAAQSSTLQVIDALLGVEHTEDKKEFLKFMQEFMIPDHRRFIQTFEQMPFKLRQFMEQNPHPKLLDVYNRCISALVNLRKYHIQIVTKYVVIASKETNEGNYESLDSKGTGGTSLIPFLKAVNMDTQSKFVNSNAESNAKSKTLSFLNTIFHSRATACVLVGLAISFTASAVFKRLKL
ncbi:myoglobin [Aplysia californica]|uniref:Myoglobin n=1 Tax=Aplysia californica TaxID=6500 RepID=A0ABM0JK53_APLCA|nr:myoglobin [Aplysia californica]